MLRIAPTTLNGYINDKRQPDFALLKEIAVILGVSAAISVGFYLFGNWKKHIHGI